MATATGTALATNGVSASASPIPEVVERVVTQGDLSKLSAEDRVRYYVARCEAAGLDPRTQPFQYLSLKGKLVLYATKAATDQLIAQHKLTVELVERRHDPDLGVYEVRCRVTFPDSHHVEDFAAAAIRGLRGEELCNALMKTYTKAKRRTVLSACGLGLMDETEVETIPAEARAAPREEPEGPSRPRPTPAPPPRPTPVGPPPRRGAVPARTHSGPMSDVRQWLERTADAAFDTFANACLLEGKDPGRRITMFQVANHLVSSWIESGALEADAVEVAGKRDRLRVAAVLRAAWDQHPDDFRSEVAEYLHGEIRRRVEEVGLELNEPDGEPIAADEVPDGDGDAWGEGRE